MPFQIIRNDITKVKADAIVNTANPKPVFAAGTDAAIYKAAGEKQLLAERKKIGDIMPGETAVTPAFSLDAKYIIHTVGPLWEDGAHGEFDILESCYRNCLQKAAELKCKSIAFPLIASGNYGFPKDEALGNAHKPAKPVIPEKEDGEPDYVAVFKHKKNDDRRFGDALFDILKGKDIDNNKAYAMSNIDRRTFSKLINGERLPKKSTVFAFCIEPGVIFFICPPRGDK